MILVFRNLLIPEWKRLQKEEQRRVWRTASAKMFAERTSKVLTFIPGLVGGAYIVATMNPVGGLLLMAATGAIVGGVLEARVAKHARAIIGASAQVVSR